MPKAARDCNNGPIKPTGGPEKEPDRPRTMWMVEDRALRTAR
jgi:hypothetical protein